MSLNDEKYLRSTDHRDVQFMEQRIKSLEEELKYTEDKSDKKRIKKEIKELENQKELKLPHHLISYGATFIAGEEPIITECYI
jgi:predicted Ser/Thr protein kinase